MTRKEIKKILLEQRQEYQRYLKVLDENSEKRTAHLAESMSGMKKELKDIRDMVAQNTEDIEMIKVEVQLIRSDLKEKVGRDEFNALEARFVRLERAVRNK